MTGNKMTSWRWARRLGLLTTVVLPGLAGSAHAQQAADAEIIVTANRKSEALSQVPASVVALDQVALDRQGVRSMENLAQVTPGVTFGQTHVAYGTGQFTISIRGVDSVSGVPTTGIYIDDTPVQTRVGVSPSLSNAYPHVFDLERVEVLRGPQGTLFGSGSVGGAVRFITPEPEYDDVSLYGRSEVGSTKNGAESYEFGLAGGAPIVEDKVGFRASASYRHDGGYIDRLDRYTGELVERDINSGSVYTARLALGLRLSDRFTVTPSIFYQNEELDDGSRFELATSDRSSGDLRLSLNEIAESREDEFFLPAVNMEFDLGGMTLVSHTSYFKRESHSLADDTTLSYVFSAGLIEGPFLPGFEDYVPYTDNRTQQEAVTQEIRLQSNDSDARFSWIAGLFYQHSVVEDRYAGEDLRVLDVINYAQQQLGEPTFPSLTDVFGVELYQGRYNIFQRNEHRDEQTAIFAQGDYEIVPRLKLTAGLRYTIADYVFEGFGAGPVYATDGRTDVADTTSETLTPKLGVSLQADDNNLFYASAAKGVRGPGVAPPVGANCAADAAAIGFDPFATIKVDPDSIWSYELGSKSRLFGGRLAIDASAYHIDWKDVQTLFALPLCTIFTTQNLGDAEIDGFDLAVNASPFDGLSLGASIAYTDARYTTDINGPDDTIIRRSGEPFPVAPWAVQLNAEYTHPVGDASELYARADYSYNSHNDKPVDAESPLVDPTLPRPPSTELVNLRFGARFMLAQMNDVDVSLFVNNATNRQPLTSLFHETPDSTWFRSGTIRPRTIGLTVTMRR